MLYDRGHSAPPTHNGIRTQFSRFWKKIRRITAEGELYSLFFLHRNIYTAPQKRIRKEVFARIRPSQELCRLDRLHAAAAVHDAGKLATGGIEVDAVARRIELSRTHRQDLGAAGLGDHGIGAQELEVGGGCLEARAAIS